MFFLVKCFILIIYRMLLKFTYFQILISWAFTLITTLVVNMQYLTKVYGVQVQSLFQSFWFAKLLIKYAYSDPFHRLAITTSKHARALQRARKILALPRIMKNKTNQTIVLYLKKMSTMTTCNFYSYHIAKVINYLPNFFSIGTFLTFRKPIKTFLTYRES